ncbi:MAG: hypothetical protein CL920_15695 [Deltaproteobacteria bacterium]|nr:hypothetical protein [Deltaproteobacteria bacterium]
MPQNPARMGVIALNRRYNILLAGLLSSFLLLAGCSTEIQHNLTENQANKIVVLFAKAGIQATKQKDASGREVKWTIVVGSSDKVKAIKLLQQHNIPSKKAAGLSETYSQTGMIPTATQERARFLMAQAGELTKTFKAIGGVLDARVHLVIPEDKILRTPGEKPPEARASVFLSVKTGQFKSAVNKRRWFAELSRDAKSLVNGSIEKLKAQNISVVIRPHVVPGESATETIGNDLQTSSVLSIRVDTKHAMRLKLILGGMVLLLVLFISLFVWFFTRATSLKNQLRALNTNAFN